MEESKRLVVKGFVQGVGYRAFTRFLAMKMGIKGKVRNLEDGRSVEIIATGDSDDLKRFAEALNIKAETPFEPDVHEIEISDYRRDEKFRTFSVDYGYEMRTPEREMIERSEIGILAFGWMGKHLGNKIDSGFDRMDSGFSELGDKMDSGFSELGEKMDSGFSELGNKMDSGFNRMDSRFSELGEKMDSGFTNVGEKIDRGFSETGKKLDEISGKLDINTEKTEELHTEMADKFEYLDVKYGEFSETLQRLEEDIKRIVKMEQDIKEIKDAFLRLVNHITASD